MWCTAAFRGFQLLSGLFRFFPPADYSPPPPSRSCSCCYQCTCIYSLNVFRESVDSAHNSRISSTFQEADCLQKLVKVNKQVFAITLLSRNLNHTAQLSISARGGEIIILSVGLGGGGRNGKDPFSFSPFTAVGDIPVHVMVKCFCLLAGAITVPFFMQIFRSAVSVFYYTNLQSIFT